MPPLPQTSLWDAAQLIKHMDNVTFSMMTLLAYVIYVIWFCSKNTIIFTLLSIPSIINYSNSPVGKTGHSFSPKTYFFEKFAADS
jgi:hypothetical protein